MICLSFDTDHMTEARMAEFLAAFSLPGQGTFFCTQRYACLEASDHELAPHPFLGEGTDWQAELRRHRKALPAAAGWRSHSCVFSHLLAEQVRALGYGWVSCHDQFGDVRVAPTRHCWGVWQLPIFYMDNLDFSQRHFWDDAPAPFDPRLLEAALSGSGVYVFDFHPIHLLLNTPNRDGYMAARDRFKQGAPLAELRHPGRGTATYFGELCAALGAAGLRSVTMSQALDRWVAELTP